MSQFFRLIKIANVAARYRLLDFLSGNLSAPGLKTLLWIYGIPWIFSGTRNLTKERRLRLALEELGPIYIKFGQLLSTRRDFLENEIADELQGLQDSVPPFVSPGIESLVSESLGVDVSTVFSTLDSNPLASASVAQVHSATLLSGEEVVVKVIRPGIEKTIRADIKLLKWLALRVENNLSVGKRLRPVEVINDYEKIILDELNLLAEGANTTQLKRNFENSEILYVPKVYWDYTRSDLLVMERIYGIPVADIDSLNEKQVDLKKLAETGVEIFFTQVFDHSFFHADMHPGNIFVNPESPQNPQYIAIDCAIIGSLSSDDQQYLARNLLAIFQRDYHKVAQLHVECGWVPKDTKVVEFESAMRTVCEPIFEKPLKDISFGHLLIQLFRTAGRFNMEVQPSLVLLQKTLLNVEGLGRQLYPELDLWQTALPFLEKWNSKRLNPLTIFDRVKDNIPDWIDQFPLLPQLVIDSLKYNSQLSEINHSMVQQQKFHEQQLLKRRKRSRVLGTVALAGAGISLIPSVALSIASIPILTIVLGAVGTYLIVTRD